MRIVSVHHFLLFLTDPSSLQSFLLVSLPYQVSLKIPFSSSLSPYNNLVCVTSFNSQKISVHLKIVWLHHFLFFFTDPSWMQSFLFVSLPYQASPKIPFFSSLFPYNNLVFVTSFNSKKSVHLKIVWVHHFLFFFFCFLLTPPRCNLFFSCPFLIKHLLKSLFPLLSPYSNLVCVTSFNSLKKSVHLKIIWVHHFLFFLTDPSLQFFLFVSLPYQASLKTPFSSSLSLLFSFFFFLFLFFVLLLFILI